MVHATTGPGSSPGAGPRSAGPTGTDGHDDDHDYDVVVVGYGPTGLVLASVLGAAGHRVLVVERWNHLYGLPRLTHIDGETARIVQNTGDVDVALRDARPLPSYRYVNGAGELLVELPWSGESSGHPLHLSIYQPDIEDAIDQRVRRYPAVEVLQGWRAVALDQTDEAVQLTVRRHARDEVAGAGSPGDVRVVRARFLVGADGANSFVRETLGIGRDDWGVDDRWLNIDTERLRDLPEDLEHLVQHCDPRRGHMHMPIGWSRQRFEVAVLPGEDASAFATEEFAWRWLHDVHGLGPRDVRILRHVVYSFEARVARRWRAGRVFLAGDAAHTTPPYMGQGACSGMRDGITLGWKLDLVLRGLAEDGLLDTYEAERRPHATAITEISTSLGRIANNHDPDAAARRDDAFRTGTAPAPPPFPTLTDGVVHRRPGGEPSPGAGELAPQGVVRGPRGVGRFDDVVGSGFTVVSSRDLGAVLDGARTGFLDQLGATTATLEPGAADSVDDLEGTYRRWFRENGCDTFVSRPDFHLYWAGSAQDLPGVLDDLGHQLHWRSAGSGASTVATAPAVARSGS